MRPTGHFWPASRINTGCVGFGLVWFGLVWFGLVWFGLVWFGLGLDGLDGWLGDLCRSLCSGSLAAWVTNRPPNACRHPRVAIALSFPRRRKSTAAFKTKHRFPRKNPPHFVIPAQAGIHGCAA